MCSTESGLCFFPNERHPENACLLCSTHGGWISRHRSKLADDEGETLLNVMPTINVPHSNKEIGIQYKGNTLQTVYIKNLNVYNNAHSIYLCRFYDQ